MAHSVYTNLNVLGTVSVQNARVAVANEALTALKQLTVQSEGIQYVSAASTQDIVLPDATGLVAGYKMIVGVKGASAASVNVKSYDETTPALLKNILAGRAYEFTLLENADAAGTWHLNYLEEADMLVAERYVHAFNATTDWTLGSGLYSLTLTAATHGRGVNPTVEVVEGGAGGPYQEVDTEVQIVANGDVTIKVNAVPDARLQGQLILV